MPTNSPIYRKYVYRMPTNSPIYRKYVYRMPTNSPIYRTLNIWKCVRKEIIKKITPNQTVYEDMFI